MPLHYEQVGLNPDGSPLFNVTITPDPEHPDRPVHAVFTGPWVGGKVTTTDGREYDVTPAYIEVDSREHAGQVSHLIGELRERYGIGPESEDEPFVHHCSTGEDDTPDCGELHRHDSKHAAAARARQERSN